MAIYSTFLNRAWDQVYYDVGLHRLPVVFCLDRAGITGDDGPSHHGVLDLMLLTKVPGMTVFAPSSYEEVGNMLHEALAITHGPGRHPVAEERGPLGRRGGQRPPGAQDPRGVAGLPRRCRQARRRLRAGRAPASPHRGRRHGLGRPSRLAAGRRHDRRRPRPRSRRLGRGRDRRRAASGADRRRHSAGARRAARPRQVVNCGVPTAYLPHGDAADILAQPRPRRPRGSAGAVLEHL